MATDVLPLSRWRARMAAPRGRRQLDALMETDDPAAAVAALRVTELYQLVYDVGLADSLELVALASAEQIRGCLDLDAWDRDRTQFEAIEPWLQAVVEAGHEKLSEVWQTLDDEFTALFLQQCTQIFDLSLGEDPDDVPEATPTDDDGGLSNRLPADERAIVPTPDGFFAVELTSRDPGTRALVHRILDDLYRADPNGRIARHTIMAARSEPRAELEEMSWRWRSGRMADLGYVEFYDALEVFRPLSPNSVRVGEGSEDRFGPELAPTDAPGPLPVPIAERVIGVGFLAQAIDRIRDPDEVARLENAFMVLVNKVLSAARVSPGDLDGQLVGAEHAASTVALGLESVSGGDLERATRALETVSLSRLHRVGYTIPLRLARLARALAPRVATADPTSSQLIAALAGRRPYFARELDDPPGVGPRPFASMADVQCAAEALTRLALRVAIAETLGADLLAPAQAPEPVPDLDDHVRTALVHAMLGESPDTAPLAAGDLARFAGSCLESAAITEGARQRAGQALLALLGRGQVTAGQAYLPGLLDGWLADLVEAASVPFDPRYTRGVLIQTTRDG